MSSTTLIVGDLHLGKGLSLGKPGYAGALNSRINDQIKLLNWIIDQAVDNNAERIVLTGDICEDIKPDYILIDYFIKFLKQCVLHNIHVDIISGNHDFKRYGKNYRSVLDLVSAADLSGVQIHKQPTTILSDGVGFTLFPFRDRKSLSAETHNDGIAKINDLLSYELSEIPVNYDKVLIGHLAIEGSIFVGDEIDNYANELMCPLSSFKEYDFTWMGHVHRPQVRSKTPHISHIGSLDISDFGETDHTKILILFNPTFPNKFKEIPVPSRPLRRVKLDVPIGFEPTAYIINQIKVMDKARSFRDAIVRVEVRLLDPNSSDINRAALEEAIFALKAYHICNISESKNIAVVPVSKQIFSDNDVANPKAAVKIYAGQLDFEKDEEREKFISYSNDIIDEYYSKIK